jgi:site-specific recombinase XerD
MKLKSLKKLGTYKRYNTTYLHLINFKNHTSKSDIKFSAIDYKFIEGFDNFLLDKGLKQNSRNNYLICSQKVFRLALKEKLFKTYEDPFLNFKFKREPVEKRRLSFGQIQSLISEPIDFNKPEYEIRMKFLLQIFGQGLRVSDLFTLRFNNIDFDSWNSRIHFFQFKTKKKHSVQLSIDLMKHIFYFADKEKYFDYYYIRKYQFEWKGKEYKFTLPHIEKELKRIKGISIKATEKEKKESWEIISKKVYGIFSEIYQEQLKHLRELALKQPNKFLVSALNEKLFENVIFNDSTILTQKQYNQLQSITTMYNRDLKKLEPYTNTIIRLTSHTPRHTYTNLLLSNNTDVYSISKSLGHSKLSITESYLNDFDINKIDSDNTELFRIINLNKISLKG